MARGEAAGLSWFSVNRKTPVYAEPGHKQIKLRTQVTDNRSCICSIDKMGPHRKWPPPDQKSPSDLGDEMLEAINEALGSK